MATITGLTAARMTEMEDATIIDGNIVGNDLVLLTKDGTPINAGNVRGPTGPGGLNGAGHIICTSATRPALIAGDEGKTIWETDTNLVRSWTGTRWQLQERIVCTSTTRPAGLVAADEGVKIYETDTNLEYVYTGSSWLPVASFVATFANAAARTAAIPAPSEGMQSYLLDTDSYEIYAGTAWRKPWNIPWGYVAGSSAITSGTTHSASMANQNGFTATFAALANRRYRAHARFHMNNNASGSNAGYRLADGGVGISGTLINVICPTGGLFIFYPFSFFWDFSLSSGTKTLTLQAQSNSANVTFADATYNGEFMIEDMGPNGLAT